MMESKGWEKLENRRYKIHLCFLYKIIHGLICTQLNDLSVFQATPSTTRFYHHNNLTILYARTDVYRFSFGPFTCANWNKLPSAIKDIESLDTFRSSLYNYLAIY